MFGPNAKHEVEISITVVQTDQGVKSLVFKEGKDFSLKVFLYCPYLSSIHKKASCTAIFWTERPHSLGSCYFRSVWATCLPHKGGGVQLSVLPKDTTSKLAGLFSTTSPKCRAPSRKLWIPFFLIFWYDSTRGMNPKSKDCEADALTSSSSRWLKLLAAEKMIECTML